MSFEKIRLFDQFHHAIGIKYCQTNCSRSIRMLAAVCFAPLSAPATHEPSKSTQNLDFLEAHEIKVIRRWDDPRNGFFEENTIKLFSWLGLRLAAVWFCSYASHSNTPQV